MSDRAALGEPGVVLYGAMVRRNTTTGCIISMKTALITLLFVGAALANWRMSVNSATESWFPISAIFLLCAVGVIARQKWIEAAIFGAGVYVAATWTCIVVLQLIDGSWPYASSIESVISIVPGLAYVFFWFLMWRLVRSHFALTASDQIKS